MRKRLAKNVARKKSAVYSEENIRRPVLDAINPLQIRRPETQLKSEINKAYDLNREFMKYDAKGEKYNG